MGARWLIATAMSLTLSLPASAECDGNALLQNNTPLSDLCPDGFGLPNAGLSIQQAMQRDANNVAMITAAANAEGVPPTLALAVAYQESQFSSCAGSDTGVKGPMQLTTSTGKGYGVDRNINEQNIAGGMKHLSYSIQRCGGTSDTTCLAKYYNGSPRPGEQAGWAKGVDNALNTIGSMTPEQFPTNCEVCEPVSSVESLDELRTDTGEAQKGAANQSTNPADYEKYVGSYQGANQECASLTKEIGGVGAASTWKQGEPVQGNADLEPGTPIATFNYGDSYGPPGAPGGASGVSHTGIYLGQSDAGVTMLHQWNGSGGAVISTIPWSSWNGNGMEGGSKYYTIM